MSTKGQVITCTAAIAWDPKKPMTIETIEVAPPKAGEVRIKVIATGVCHSDVSLLDGFDPQGKFPCILGHEGAGIVESVGPGVTSLKEGDHVIPLFIPQCRNCNSCKNPKTNLCEKLNMHSIQGPGVMNDGTSRFSCKGQTIYNFLAVSTFTQYTVLNEIAVAKVNVAAPLNKVCLLGCGISTGYGAAINTAKVTKGSICAVWGLGTIGLAAVMGCKWQGASRIIGVDINPDKLEIAKKFGVTDFVNPKDYTKPIQEVITELTNGGCDYTFEAVGSVRTMQAAFESCKIGVGESIAIGVTPFGDEIGVKPLQLLFGKTLKGTLFGGCKSRDMIPEYVDRYMDKKLMIDEFITGTISLSEVNEAMTALRQGKVLRNVINLF